MNILFLFLSIVLALVFISHEHLKYERFKSIKRLEASYEKMEFYFLLNKISLTKEKIKFLKIFKNFIVNPEYLDIQVLLSQMHLADREHLEKNRIWFEKQLTSLGSDFTPLLNQYDNHTYELIKLSCFKFDFVWFAFMMISRSIYKNGKQAFNLFISDLKFVKNNEEAISLSGSEFKDLNIC